MIKSDEVFLSLIANQDLSIQNEALIKQLNELVGDVEVQEVPE